MNKQTDNPNTNLIENLNTSEEIKDVLRKINSVASSNNPKMKQSIKNIFIVSPTCDELSKIAMCYERIITTNRVYPTRGTKTYLELAFPASGKDIDYREFFASPKLVAATQNYFTGVFLISFEQWKSASELIRDIAFVDLTNFINSNKEHISFVFHVTPQFKDAKQLQKEFAKHLNICQIEHSLPDLKNAIQYVEKQLCEGGVELNASGKRELKKLLEEKIDVTSNSYYGYRTLEQLVSNLLFEFCAVISEKSDSVEEMSFSIGKEEVKGIASKIDIPDESDIFHSKLGFY
ncbi:MAG: hypothetical protein ACI4F4_09520 [Lachnospiraceae bacterium]